MKAAQGRARERGGVATAARVLVLVGLLVGLLTLPGTKQLGTTAKAVGDPVIAAAGDIACDPTNSNFNGGNGSSGSCAEKATSDLLLGIAPAAVLNLGDNQYYCGGLAAFQQSYDPSWGRLKSITHPVGRQSRVPDVAAAPAAMPTNAGGDGYYSYFGCRRRPKGQGYYSYDVGSWHLIALNSNCGDAGGCSATSPQGKWLADDLAAHPNYCTLAYWHIPLFSSGGRAANNSQVVLDGAVQRRRRLVLNGHDHIYERFAPQTRPATRHRHAGCASSSSAPAAPITRRSRPSSPNSEIRNSDTFGVLKLTLHPTSYDWQFIRCRARPSPTPARRRATALSPTPARRRSPRISLQPPCRPAR